MNIGSSFTRPPRRKKLCSDGVAPSFKESENEKNTHNSITWYLLLMVFSNMKVPSTRGEWIDYLFEMKAIPVRNEHTEGNVYFRRLKIPEDVVDPGRRILGKETRKRVAEVLGIDTEEDCRRMREIIKSKMRN